MKTVEKYHLIINRMADRGRAGKMLPSLEEKLRRSGLPHQMHFTDSPGDATKIAERLPDGTTVVAVGGDGTINEVVNGLCGKKCVLSIIPAGSGNDFAKMFELSPSKDGIIHRLEEGKIRQIDIGKVHIKRQSGVEFERYFVNAVGIGLDAMVSHINSQFEILKGFPAYAAAAFKAIATYRPIQAALTIDGQSWQGWPLLIAAGNGTTVGGGFRLTPDAKIDDGLLDVCWAEQMPLRRILRILPTVLNGKHLKYPEVRSARGRELIFTSTSGIPVHVDGEMMGLDVVAVTVTVAEEKLNFLV